MNDRANFFEEENGALSMRRLLAFMFALASIGIAITSIVFNADWKSILAGTGLPVTGSLLMMFFTSWADVANIINTVKK